MTHERDFFARLANCATHYVVWLNEPVPQTPFVGIPFLLRSMFVCWTDCVEADPKAKKYADRVVGYTRRYREGKVSVEKAVAGIERAKIAYLKYKERKES